MVIKKVEIKDEEIIVTEVRKGKIQINELINYVLKRGFEYEGVWYFRKTWMDAKNFRLLKQSGLIEKFEPSNILRQKEVRFPKHGGGLLYMINNDQINGMISEER